MSDPNKVLDIPGYYYDTVSRRYFRQDPVNPKPRKIAKTQTNWTEGVSQKLVKKPQRNIINLLNRRENGSKKYSFENQVLVSKTTKLYCVERNFCMDRSFNCEDVEFVKGGTKTVYVEYSNKQRNMYFLDEKMTLFSPSSTDPNSVYFKRLYSTVDLIESPNYANFLLVIVSNSNYWRVIQSTKNSERGRVRHQVYCKREPIWCCAKNDFSAKVVYGETNNIFVSTLQRGSIGDGWRLPAKGEVRSAEFDKQGNLLFTGRHTGHIENIDLRTKNRVFYNKLHTIGIDETVLLSDQNYLICGAFDGMICKVDLRMRKPVGEYLGHVSTPRKCSFSLCEYNHLLCATGSDYVTRIWDLSAGGEPLKCIMPPISRAPCRSWLASDGYKFAVYIYQKQYMYYYDSI